MSDRSERILSDLAALAADVGPAIAPVGLDEMLRAITEAAQRLFEASACSLALLDDAGEELVFRVASGAGADEVVGLRIPAGSGIAGWVVMSGQPIAVDDVRADPRFARDTAQSTGYVPRTILAMPLESERRMLGAIEVLDRRGGGSGGVDDMELLGVFARQAAAAIESARVFSDMGRELLAALALLAAEPAGGDAGGAGAAGAAAGSDDLRVALERAAEDAPGPAPGLGELAAMMHDLGQLGEEERDAAVRIVRDFLAFARRRRRR